MEIAVDRTKMKDGRRGYCITLSDTQRGIFMELDDVSEADLEQWQDAIDGEIGYAERDE